jgi:hypothetical protein
MHRECTQCHRPFTPKDFAKEESKDMEGFRKALALEGVRFLYYSCAECGHDDVFVDIHVLAGEDKAALDRRREDAETVVLEYHGNKVEAVFSGRPLA